MLQQTIRLLNENAQREFGVSLAKSCTTGILIFLQGDLGTGKTTLARGFLQGLGYSGKVKSPTYTLIETYAIDNRHVLHVDLYRLTESQEIFSLGLLDQLDDQTLCLIEWPEQALPELPMADLTCYIARLLEGRELRVIANTNRGEQILQRMVCEWDS